MIPGEFSKRSEEESQQPHPRNLDAAHAQGRVKLCAHKLLVGCAEFNVEYGKCVEMHTMGVPGNKQAMEY
ncbi:Protein of unknown function [Pyronema omphalodes CBS 100304]|uniref:Uncharacterized protein n=1 Tax=Pyronema omphalodes (strain CBS 100304) TaxID=1076935 RepID=U4LMN7_PYROM|nr:Protein of unknown function [Pyronema omphalodes CBS 100304]